MNYFFTPFTLVNQYQPFYALPSPFFIDTTSYLFEEPKLEKQTVSQKQTILLIEPENASNIQDQVIDYEKTLKNVKRKEDKNFGFREQDKERNIYSNILKGFFVSLCEKRSMDAWINKILSENSCSSTLEQILGKIEDLFGKNKSYFSPKQVRQTLKRKRIGDNIEAIIGKCLNRYLKSQFSLSLLVSTRIKRKSKLLQMRKGRQLLCILNGSQ